MRKNNFFKQILAVAVIAITLFAVTACAPVIEWEEVETYTVGCEVSHMDYAERAISRFRTVPVYVMSVRCDDFATTFEVTAKQYAKYTIDEVVEVEVCVMEDSKGNCKFIYNLIG